MMLFKGAVAGAAILALAACTQGEAESAPEPDAAASGWSIDPGADLNAFFECLEAEGAALVSAHRGGPAPGYPENALETIAQTLSQIPALIEIDVATSADGVLYLMHDDTLDRTTTGEGGANALAWREIARLRLENETGAATAFAPPTLEAALAFAAGRTILKLDIKRTTRYEDVVAAVRAAGAERRVVLIAYTDAQARKLHALAPEMMISASLSSISGLNGLVAAGVPADRALAFTGLDAPDARSLDALNARDVEIILGTLGGRDSIDRAIAESGDDSAYADFAAMGVDILATDRPVEAHRALAAAGRAPESGDCGVQQGGDRAAGLPASPALDDAAGP